MSDKSDLPAGDAAGHSAIIRPEESGISSGAGRWVMAAVVTALLIYPVARWMMGGGAKAAATQAAAGATEFQLSFEHYQAGRYQEAIAAAKAAIAANPNFPDAYNNLAVSYLGLHMYDEGIQAAQEAIRLKPDYQLAKNNLAWIQREKVTATGAPVPASASSVAAVLLNKSLRLYQEGQYKECLDAATESARLDPNSAAAFNNIGICAGGLQLWDEAIRNTQEAIRLNQGFQLARNNLTWLQQQKTKAGGTTSR